MANKINPDLAREAVSLRAPEVRTFPTLQIRDLETDRGGRYIEGRAVPYDDWTDVGWFMERFSPGAFTKSINESARGLPLLLWHDNQTFPIGVSERWRETSTGLDGVWRIDTDDALAVEGARKAADGLLTGMSVGFVPVTDKDDLDLDDNGLPWVTRNEARLLEVSLTPTPAYAGAKVALVRSRQRQGRPATAQRRAEIGAWRDYLTGANR